MRLWITFSCLYLCAAAAADDHLPGTGVLLLTDGPPALALSTDIDIHVSGMVSRVSVRQQFRNDGDDFRDGRYVFPLPDTVAVDQMRVRIGDRVVEGEIREKAEARRQFESARQSGRRAGLVSQRRANLFETAIANIAPGESMLVEIEYLEQIDYKNGAFEFRLPLTVTPRYASADVHPVSHRPTPVIAVRSASAVRRPVSIDVYIDAGLPLDLIDSRYHPIVIEPQGRRYHVQLAAGRVPMDRDFELRWQPEPSAMPRAMSFSDRVSGEPHHLLMLLPPSEGLLPTTRMPRELLLVIDTSGSMQGTPLEQARSAVLRALDELRPDDLFNVIRFSSSTSAVFETSVAATEANIAKARRALRGFDANGGTEMGPALEFALNSPRMMLHLRQVVFVTDGAIGNEEALFAQIERDLGNARVFTVGIGSAPNGWFMRRAAELGRGSHTLIASIDEVAVRMSALLDRLQAPQLTDIEIDWPVDAEVYPATTPDLYAGEPVVLRLRSEDELDAVTRVRIRGQSPAGPWSTDMEVQSDYANLGVGSLWARAKIADAMDRLRRGSDETDIRDEVVDTALTYRLISRYTSLVAVDRTPVRPAGIPSTEQAVANLRPAGLTGFPATATPQALLRLAGIAFMSLALAVAVLSKSETRRALA